MTQMTPLGTVPPMPRKRRDDRPKDQTLTRINVEVYPDEEVVIARAKAAASLKHQTFRAWLVNALREQAEREARGQEGGDGRQA